MRHYEPMDSWGTLPGCTYTTQASLRPTTINTTLQLGVWEVKYKLNCTMKQSLCKKNLRICYYLCRDTILPYFSKKLSQTYIMSKSDGENGCCHSKAISKLRYNVGFNLLGVNSLPTELFTLGGESTQSKARNQNSNPVYYHSWSLPMWYNDDYRKTKQNISSLQTYAPDSQHVSTGSLQMMSCGVVCPGAMYVNTVLTLVEKWINDLTVN